MRNVMPALFAPIFALLAFALAACSPAASTGPQAAGVIHTDFEKGYIRAQTIAFNDFIQYKGEQGAKDAGKMRAEGKEYVVKDGDVMNFLFSS